MTLTSRALGLTLAAALSLSGSGLLAGAAQAQDRAPGHTYGTLITFEDAKLKACRVPIRQGRAFRVFAFLDNTANPRRDEMSAEISVTKKGRTTPEGFGSGFIRGGRSSSVGDLIVPRTRAFQLVFSVETRHSAVGGNLDKEQIRRC